MIGYARQALEDPTHVFLGVLAGTPEILDEGMDHRTLAAGDLLAKIACDVQGNGALKR